VRELVSGVTGTLGAVLLEVWLVDAAVGWLGKM
jgi:hypothetical protein